MERYFSETELKKYAFLIDNDYNNFSFSAINTDDLDGGIPTADVKPVIHGCWKVNCETPYCSICGAEPESFFHTEGYDGVCMNYGKDAPKYCPNCGAKMDKKV